MVSDGGEAGLHVMIAEIVGEIGSLISERDIEMTGAVNVNASVIERGIGKGTEKEIGTANVIETEIEIETGARREISGHVDRHWAARDRLHETSATEREKDRRPSTPRDLVEAPVMEVLPRLALPHPIPNSACHRLHVVEASIVAVEEEVGATGRREAVVVVVSMIEETVSPAVGRKRGAGVGNEKIVSDRIATQSQTSDETLAMSRLELATGNFSEPRWMPEILLLRTDPWILSVGKFLPHQWHLLHRHLGRLVQEPVLVMVLVLVLVLVSALALALVLASSLQPRQELLPKDQHPPDMQDPLISQCRLSEKSDLWMDLLYLLALELSSNNNARRANSGSTQI